VKYDRVKGWKIVVFSIAAKVVPISEKEVKTRWKKSRNIMLLLKCDGPESLLRLGTAVNTM